MNFFDKIKGKLFPKQEKPNAAAPFVKEQLKRSEKHKYEFDEWLDSRELFQLLNFLQEHYHLSKEGKENQGMIRVLHGNSSNGFMFRYPQNCSKQSFSFLFDYFAQRVKELGYYQYLADVKYFTRKKDKNEFVEEVSRYYLKPSFRRNQTPEGEKAEQLYGNILIEHYSIDDVPSHIKFLANNYTDHKFKEARPFEDLINKIKPS